MFDKIRNKWDELLFFTLLVGISRILWALKADKSADEFQGMCLRKRMEYEL